MTETRPSKSLGAAFAAAVDARWDDEVGFLRALVRQPSDNPLGDCAVHAAVTASLLEDLGFVVERHPVPADAVHRSEEHTSELQSLMRISYAVFCLKKKITKNTNSLNAFNRNK